MSTQLENSTLVQNVDPIAAEAIPFKSYEYLLAGPPIFALLHRNPELAGLLRERGHVAVESDDPVGIANGIHTLLAGWRSNWAAAPAVIAPLVTVRAAVQNLVREARRAAAAKSGNQQNHG